MPNCQKNMQKSQQYISVEMNILWEEISPGTLSQFKHLYDLAFGKTFSPKAPS